MRLNLPARGQIKGSLLALSLPICFIAMDPCPQREEQSPVVASVQGLSQGLNITCQQVGEGVSETSKPIAGNPEREANFP